MPTWPSSLPQNPLQRGFEETFPDLILRSQPDMGPAKVRKRFSANVTAFRLSFRINKDQRATLLSFYLNDAGAGSVSFDFTHPVTEQTISLRFVEPPKVSAVGPNRFNVNMTMEALP